MYWGISNMATPSGIIILKLHRAAQLARAVSAMLEDDIQAYGDNPNTFPYTKQVDLHLAQISKLLLAVIEEWEGDA